MRWFNKIKSALIGAFAAWKGSTYNFTSWYGRNFWGVDNSKLATNETIFSLVSRLSNTMASLPLKLYKNYDVVSNQAADVLINSPNPNQTPFEFIRQLEVSRDERGNGYAVIQRDIRGQIERLTILDPTYVDPVIEEETEELWYKIRGKDGTYYIHNLDMIHVKHISSTGSIAGIDPIKALTNTHKYDQAVREFSLKEMESAPFSFILKYGQNISKEKREEVIEDFKRFYQDNGGILFREPGVEIDKFERKYIAADTFMSERITLRRVANVYNVPVTLLNDTEGQSYSSNEELMRTFVQLTIIPIVRQYEQEFNRKLLTPGERKQGYYFKLGVGALLRGDVKARTALYHAGLRDGWLTRDEVRMWEDLPPKGGRAAELLVSGDMYPLDMDPIERKRLKETERG